MSTLITVISLIAGVLGTGMGGLLGAMLSERDDKTMGRILSFAGGVMLGVVGFEMLPEAAELFEPLGRWGFLGVIGGGAVGALAIFVVNLLLDLIEKRQAGDAFRQQAVINSLSRGSKIKNRRLFKAGVVMLIAISLHNLPEGMAIGASGAQEISMGITVAAVLMLHNIPEGMAIGAPLATSGMNRALAILLSALAGGATVLGAVIGQLLGGLGGIATGACLALASGGMLYVTLTGMFEEATALKGGKFPSISVLIGVACAAVFVFGL